MDTNSVFMGNQEYTFFGGTTLEQIIKKAKAGDQDAFSSLYNAYFKKIYTFIFYRVSHKEIAEDLAEDVFIKAYHKISTIKDAKSFEAWLYQIARNRVIDHYREKKIEVNIDELENVLEYESTVVDAVNLGYDQKLLLELLGNLSDEQQLVIRLKFLDELENFEIAALIGKTEGAIRVIQHRALAKLQELIKHSSRKD
jgi:RNA polymerase sigma-70 factor, ECF subfamily